MIKILHTGDLHLGSAFASFSVEESERRQRAQLDAFHKMLSVAVAEGVSLLLVAGDLFDEETPCESLTDEVFGAFASLSFPVVIAPGNHDPYTARSPYADAILPPNVFVFREEHLARFHFDDPPVDVYGYAFTGSSLTESPLSDAADNACLGDGLSVLLAHGDLDLPLSRYAPIRSADIARSGADYAALGHVHNVGDPLYTFGETRAAYCGFFLGRSFDECGRGGFRILTFDETESLGSPLVSEARIKVEGIEYRSESLTVTGAESDSDVVALLKKLLKEKGIGRETVLRVTLEGEVSLRYEPVPSEIESAFRDDTDPVSITVTDKTLPIYDAAYLENDPTLKGAFYRTLLPKLLSDNKEERADAAAALRIGLAALHGRPIS